MLEFAHDALGRWQEAGAILVQFDERPEWVRPFAGPLRTDVDVTGGRIYKSATSSETTVEHA
ncbi:TPA: hypothetical protein L5995_09650 [Pseudomonas aeruginosa]|nr:hypothetical protein BKN47_13745 [Pseudomonas aeruginosa]HBP6125883.1 hypothetical protein [Pseudomonas aeruginosa]HBP6243637.1 hypothetical protein [Pseudomonas aeruginosa]